MGRFIGFGFGACYVAGVVGYVYALYADASAGRWGYFVADLLLMPFGALRGLYLLVF